MLQGVIAALILVVVLFFILVFTICKIGITARMAELVDAHGSGSCVRKDVLVRFQFRAQNSG